MFTTLLSMNLLFAGADPQPMKKEPPAKKELFAKEDWYQSQEGKEQEWVGVLKYSPREEGVIGFGRFNAYTLELADKKGIREVYVGGKEEILKEYNGRKIKLIGKAVDMEVEGRMHKEIWPTRVELVPEKGK
jgi:hypothetical protein